MRMYMDVGHSCYIFFDKSPGSRMPADLIPKSRALIVVYLKSVFFGDTACPEPAVPGNLFETPLEPYSYRC